MEFTFKQDAYNKKIYELIKELPLRIQSVINHFPDEIAVLVHQQLLRTAPRDIPKYPKSLKVRKIKISGLDSAAGIVIPGYDYYKKLGATDVPETVLYIKPREYAGRPLNPGAVILSRNGPWTMSTLPYEPDKTEASIQSRKVSPIEVQKVDAQRRADLPRVKSELLAAGIKSIRIHPVLLQRKVKQDIAFEILRREFGINAKHHAHWRPAIRAAKRKYVKSVMKEMVRWLAVPSERKWKTEVVTPKEKTSTVKGIQEFQDYVAVKGR